MTDVATPRASSRRRPFIVLAVVGVVLVVLVVGLFVLGSSAASNKASAYDDDFAAWSAKERPVLLAATASLPKGTYLRKNVSGAKELATQKKGCDAVAASRKKIRASAGRLPALRGGGAFGKISSTYSDMGDKSDRRAKIVGHYVKAASDTLAQLERDCRWNISYNTAQAKSNELFQRSDKFLFIKGGAPEPGAACNNKTSCISSITKKKNAYADLRIRALKLTLQTSTSLLKSKDCEATSYRTACRTMAETSSSSLRAELKSYQFVRAAKSTIGNTGIDKRQAAVAKIEKKNTALDREAVLAAVPALKNNKAVTKNPEWSDPFFASVAKLLIAKLDAERAALGKL